MELVRIISKRKIRHFSTYDMEWVPGSLRIRCVGIFDGERYEHFLTVKDFLNSVLTPSNHGRWFYAHSGGLHDVQFVLDELAHNKAYEVDAAFSGSSAIIVTVKRGKHSWHFIDSLWLFRNSLDDIAKSLKMEKTGAAKLETEEEKKEWYSTIPLPILLEYNENDCRVLYRAIADFQCAILEMGGQLQMTIASTSMHLFRRKYLQKPIYTSELVNEKAALSYVASRVEVIALDCEDSYYYDINSSFPYAMTFPIPGSATGQYAYLRESLLADDTPILVWARVEVPDCYLPPLPLRRKSRIYFPVGKWDGWFTGPDLKLLLREGGKIHKTGEVYTFEKRWDLRDFANDLYRKRNEVSDKFHRYTYKIVLNSNYGKWAEGLQKEKLHINPSQDILDRLAEKAKKLNSDSRSLYMKRPGIWVEPVIRRWVTHRHVIVSSYITARARATIFDYMSQSNEVHYCDTDGFSSGTLMETSDELGGLKLEKIIRKATFLAPKVYRIDGIVNGKEKTIVKAKGFSLKKSGDEIEAFEKLKKGESTTITRMSRIKENLNRGSLKPVENDIEKTLRMVQRPKRYMYPSGETRPWSVDELDD